MTPLPLPPRLETERLLLRPWELADAAQLEEALGESVDHLLPWIPWATREAPSRKQTEGLLAGWIAQRVDGDNFMYAVFDRETGTLVGGIGLYARVGPDALEVGYWIRQSAAGRGLATEATRALTGVGLGVPGIRRLEIHTDPRNLASRRVPEKLGYTLTIIRRGEYGLGGGEPRDTAIYELRG